MAQGSMSSILVKIWITVRIQESEVRNLHSLDYRKSCQQILMKLDFDEILWRAGMWPRDQHFDIHFGDNPHHYPDPGIPYGSSGKNCHVVSAHRTDALKKSFSHSIMLAFGGGLCSLSTSS